MALRSYGNASVAQVDCGAPGLVCLREFRGSSLGVSLAERASKIIDVARRNRDLDPEEARSIVDPALKLMMDAVHHYGGYVAQIHRRDGIFALFGAPIAHEDHPQRALYAALRMQEEVKGFQADLLLGLAGRATNADHTLCRTLSSPLRQRLHNPALSTDAKITRGRCCAILSEVVA
jgi:hypothetical protein